MLFSAFAPFGMLDFSGDESEGEKVYKSLCNGYRDPRSGEFTIDLEQDGTNYQEAKVYATAMAIAGARVTLRRAHAQLRPETSYELLQAHEDRFQVVPGPNDSVTQRRAVLASRQKLSRGPRKEAIDAGLRAILGDDFIKYRTISASEATVWPSSPEYGPGTFPRPDVPARTARLLAPIGSVRTACDQYTLGAGTSSFGATRSEQGQSFSGNGQYLLGTRFWLKKTGAPTGPIRAKVYNVSGGIPSGDPIATSRAIDIASLTTAFLPYDFEFDIAPPVTLAAGITYAVAIEYTNGDGANYLDMQADVAFPVGGATYARDKGTGVWTALGAIDHSFAVYSSPGVEVPFENWNPLDGEVLFQAGEWLTVQAENLGLAEKVYVLSCTGSGDDRRLRAVFRNPHDNDSSASTGPCPIWISTKRFVLIVVASDAALDTETVQRINAFMETISRSVTDWAIVRPTTPGATTIGPLTLDSSPLGLVTIGQITI